MSANDAEVAEEDRGAAVESVMGPLPTGFHRFPCVTWWAQSGEPQGPALPEELPRVAQLVANTRRDAYRAGQIAGLEEAKKTVDHNRILRGSLGEASRSIDARIRELKGET